MKQEIPGHPMPGYNIYPEQSPEQLHKKFIKKEKKFNKLIKKVTPPKLPNWMKKNTYVNYLPHEDLGWTQTTPNPDVAPWWKSIQLENKKQLEIIKKGINKNS